MELTGYAVVHCCRSCLSTLSNGISSEATGPIVPKFHLWHSWARGLKGFFFFFFFLYKYRLFSFVAMATKISIGL